MKIAVIGGGISGLSAAWLLSCNHKVTLFEAERRLGGYTHTVDVRVDGVSHPVDTGFLVYNDRTYPNPLALFETLGIRWAESEMSFSDQALGILADATRQEKQILGAITYQLNLAVLHTDESFLPKNPKAWAAWNYHAGAGLGDSRPVALSYLINKLQPLPFWFCGAWTRYGFHEDGLLSGIRIARSLGVSTPWQEVEVQGE